MTDPGLAAAVAGGGTFPGVRSSVLLTGFQTDWGAVVADGLLVASAGLYLVGTRRLARRGRRWPIRRAAGFFCGLVLVWVAVGSGLAAYDDTNVTLHVVQHALLMMVGPPLIVLGQPLLLAAQAAGRPNQLKLTRVLRSRVLATLTSPVIAWPLYIGAMYLLFLDRSVFHYLITHQTAHDASHVVLLTLGLLYWQPLAGVESAGRRISAPARMLSIMAAMPLEAFVGVWLEVTSTPIDPVNTLADTHLAGQVFLILATLSCGVWAAVVAVQWYMQALREDRRETARAEAAGWAWTTPPWEQAPSTTPVPPSGL